MNRSLFIVTAVLILSFFLTLGVLILILRRRAEKSRHSFQTTFPAPLENKEAWQKVVGELLLLGFRYRESFNKMSYGLWNSPADLYIHEVFDAYAELAYFPSGKIQLQFTTLFTGTSITTLFGERSFTVNLYSAGDAFSAEAGNITAVWNSHMGKVQALETASGDKPISAHPEAYHDFVNLFKSRLHARILSEVFSPKTIDDFLILGYAYLDAFREEESLKMFESALAVQSVNPKLYELTGKAALYFSNLNKARTFLQKAFEFNPNDRDTLFLLIYILLESGQDKPAFDYLMKARERFPNEPNVILQLGLLSLKFGRLKEAQDFLEEINDASMASAALFHALSELYRRLGDAKRSKKYDKLAGVFRRRKTYWEELKWNNARQSRRR